MRKSKLIPITIVLAFLLAMGLSKLHLPYSIHLLNKPTAQNQFHGSVLNEPRPLKPFQLTTTEGEALTPETLKNHWTFLFFGFTHCGMLCPTTMAELGRMERLLIQQQTASLPHVIMISIDPKHDTSLKLKQFVKSFHENFWGATGDEASIHALATQIGISYANQPIYEASATPDIEHTGTIVLINPQSQIAAYFTLPHHAALLANDYRLLLTQYSHKGTVTQ